MVSAIAAIALVQHQRGLANPGDTLGASLSPQKRVGSPPPDLSLHYPPSISPPTQGSCEDGL